MPDMSNVDSEKILSAVGQLDGVVDRMNSCTGKFADAIERLDSGWVSEVKAPFMASYQKDLEAMHEMVMQLHELNSGLRDAAAEFDKTETDVLSGVRTLG